MKEIFIGLKLKCWEKLNHKYKLKKMKQLLTVFISCFILFACAEKTENYFNEIEGQYFGQKPPGNIPEIFAPGIISTGFDELFGTFTPNGKEFYYILAGNPYWTINVVKQKNDKWLKPEIASFSDQYISKFCLSPDAQKVILTSFCNDKRTKEKKITTSWFVDRTENGWAVPQYIEGLDSAFAPSIAQNGNLYFFKVGEEHQDLYYSEFKNGVYQTPINMGDSINSLQNEADPFIAPDESFILWNSNRNEGEGIYVSFKRSDGTWTKAKNIGKEINDIAPVNVASISPDGRYIFLFSNKYHFTDYRYKEISYEEKMSILNSPGNGSIDIYWVSAKIIEELKPSNIN